jgi:hypothetical protein
MEAPRWERWKVRDLVGSGRCGRVFLAEDEAGILLAVKVFHDEAINWPLLAEMTGRLEQGGWPEGVMPVLSADFGESPAVRASHWHGRFEGGTARPASLHHRLAEHPGRRTAELVRELARALAAMHARGVAHGNLKPGNVFFGRAGEVLLSDWTLGNMPGVADPGFTDALLYQPPEQLENPSGYLDGAGFRWDVFSFGVLAYRLLTGRFPRCDETFGVVAPAPGGPLPEGIQADLPKIARRLRGQAETAWPDEAAGRVEEHVRRWIDRCLALDPDERPRTMREVAVGLERAGGDQAPDHPGTAAEPEFGALLDQRRAAGHRAARAYLVAALALIAALVLAGLWWLASRELDEEKDGRVGEVSRLRGEAASAREARAAIERAAEEAIVALVDETDQAQLRLADSRRIADRLFAWAMEDGNRRLPPLEGREERLRRLELYLEDFLESTAGQEALEEERARVRLQLVEISLAEGDTATAAKRLAAAADAWQGRPIPPELRLRMAKDRLELALLMQAAGDLGTAIAFAEARQELVNLPQIEVGSDRLHQLLAVMDYHEAKLLAARGEEELALEQLTRAAKTLNRLADQRPDAVLLRSELAGSYLSYATLLEGFGRPGDAREVRALASEELAKLLKARPDDADLMFELAGSYVAMADAAVSSGDPAAAEQLTVDALGLLRRVTREQPENARALARMAAALGLRAGLMRDRGEAAEAMRTYDEGVRLIESARASAATDPTVAYHLALLWWQKARMLGTTGQRDEEIQLLVRANGLLLRLQNEKHPEGPPLDQVQRSQAYLLGDLGHARQLADQRDEARASFREAMALWEELVRQRRDSEEFAEGLAWCAQRVKDLE